MTESIGFVLFALYFRSLKDIVAYMLLFMIFISYIIYRYYLLSLERSNDNRKFEVSVTYNGLMRIRFIRRTKLIFAETLGIEQR